MSWETFPLQCPGIFSDILMIVSLERPEKIFKWRQVCQTWNKVILHDILGTEAEDKKRILRERIQRNWGPGRFPSEEEISLARMLEAEGYLDCGMIQSLTERVRGALRNGGDNTTVMCGAALAHHGLLGSMERLWLSEVDLSEIPHQLASLASCVTGVLYIKNVTGSQQIVSLLTSLNCSLLDIERQRLGREETQAMVQAMQSGVEWVWLWEEVSLDIKALSEYSGQGVCRTVEIHYDTRDRYKEDMKTWAGNRNWRVVKDTDREFYIGY